MKSYLTVVCGQRGAERGCLTAAGALEFTLALVRPGGQRKWWEEGLGPLEVIK